MVGVADAGWGKTVFAGSDEGVLFLTCDPEGTVSAGAMGSSAEEWPIKTYKDLDEAYRWLRDEGHEEFQWVCIDTVGGAQRILQRRSEEHTSELQSLMRISYAVFCLNTKNT